MVTRVCAGCNNIFTTTDIRKTRCRKNCGRDGNSSRARRRENHEVEFIGIDGEGSGEGSEHVYCLLGIGDSQLADPAGLVYSDVFEFLYSHYQKNKEAAYVGFFLGYDFTQWLRSLPMGRAWYLLSLEGQARRKRVIQSRRDPFPVECDGWQFDTLGDKRFKLRPTPAGKSVKGEPWMWICDAGPFFQTSLMNVIDPVKWPTEPICTEEEYAVLLEGKSKRSTAILDSDMRRYNTLENNILSRLMSRTNTGFSSIGIRLNKNQWFGPGQAAQEWLKLQSPNLKREYLAEIVPAEVWEAARKTYYGGWFELMCHGHVPGESYEYDINSAYPYAIASLPCLEHGRWTHKRGRRYSAFEASSGLCIVRASVLGSDRHIGAALHRREDGSIARPLATAGWYWQHELNAAHKAGLIDTAEVYESWEYSGDACHSPLAGLAGLYEYRRRIGKDTPEGKGAKLIYNSVYGKFAQSVGHPMYANSIYASLITSLCRSQILHAITSHPEGSSSVVMIATDGVYFTSRHPTLKISESLGEWGMSLKNNLTLFKPGVYWDDTTRRQISEGHKPVFKSRGVNAESFGKAIAEIDEHFRQWTEYPDPDRDPHNDRTGGFPKVSFELGFSMVTARQAIQRHRWATAGHVSSKVVVQDSDPLSKRRAGYRDGNLYRSLPWPEFGYGGTIESTPYDKRFGITDPDEQGITPDGTVMDAVRDVLVRRG